MNIQEITQTVYQSLKNRDINPRGNFDGGGKFHALHEDLINVRTPSRAYPFSEMTACRTLKYVKKVVGKFNCTTLESLIAHV